MKKIFFSCLLFVGVVAQAEQKLVVFNVGDIPKVTYDILSDGISYMPSLKSNWTTTPSGHVCLRPTDQITDAEADRHDNFNCQFQLSRKIIFKLGTLWVEFEYDNLDEHDLHITYYLKSTTNIDSRDPDRFLSDIELDSLQKSSEYSSQILSTMKGLYDVNAGTVYSESTKVGIQCYRIQLSTLVDTKTNEILDWDWIHIAAACPK